MLATLLKSRTAWAAVLTLIANGLSLAGIEVNSESLQKAIDSVITAVQIVGPIAAVIYRGLAKPAAPPG